MSGSINEYLIAEKDIQHKEHGTTQTSEHTTHNGGDIPPGEVFPTLLSTLGEHREMTFFNVHICDLPVIVYDKNSGLLTYGSVKQMENTGVYTLDHHTHQIVKSSNHEPPTLDMSITSLVVFEWIAMFFVILVFLKSAKRYKKNTNKAPKGLQNIIESGVVFVRDDIVGPNINNKEVVNKLLPFFVVLFFFILFMNLIGLIPGGHTATGSLAVTAALAICAFLVINVTQIKDVGIKAYLKHLLGGAPVALAPIMIPIEILSMFTKPFALTVRLFANMTAGHVVLLSLVGLIFYFKSFIVSPVSVGFSIFMYFIEILVAFLQAYIFVILTAVFTGLGMSHDHAGHEEKSHA
jgi:F-type H+-transporting ATPase subunit a